MEDELPEIGPSFWETYKVPLIISFIGIFLLLVGIRVIFSFSGGEKVQFTEESTTSANLKQEVIVEASGAVQKPGVYTFTSDERIQDLLLIAGGLSASADREWIAKYINLAGKLTDGTKIYFPYKDEAIADQKINSVQGVSTTASKSFININTASSAELESLPGIGEVTANKIIENRPYQSIDELLNKKVVGKSVFEKIKEKISIY